MARSRQATTSRASIQRRLPVGRLLGQVDRQITRLLEVRVLGNRGLTIDQWRVLDILADGEGHPMSELAATIVVPGATLTKIMDKLVDAALVYRLVDDRDRRRVLAFLSEKGVELHSELTSEVAAAEARMLESLGENSCVLVELLAQLAANNVAEPTRA